MAGYGPPCVAGSSLQAFDGVRRGGENFVYRIGYPQEGIPDNYLVARFDISDPLPLEDGATPGDSGEPWEQNVNGTEEVVGLADFVAGDYTSYGSDTAAIRVSLYDQSWIEPMIHSGTDTIPPTSTVGVLPTYSPGGFTVNWSGNDNAGGSGLASYSIYVSDNGGAYTLWQAATTQTSATFTGVNGHTYTFYSMATDNVGNSEATPATPEATTQVDTIAPAEHGDGSSGFQPSGTSP